MSTDTQTLQERTAGLNPQWQWAFAQNARLGWELFAAQDRVRTTPGWEGDDWSKSPRGRCKACRATMHGPPTVRGADCYAACRHAECHGLLGATTDPDAILRLARKYPRANTALRTGRVSNALVLDVDGDKGLARLAELEAEHGELPPTRRFQTGGGTHHYLFDYPQRPNPARTDGQWRNSAGTKLGDGLDVRAEGGYVLLPWSNSRKGPYRLDRELPQAPAPEWLLDLLSTPTAPKAPHTREQRRDAVAAVDFTGAAGVHPYAAAALTQRVADFRALVGEGNGRTYALTGGAKYLSGIANHPPESGLTEDMIRDAYTDAARANGYADAHPDWDTQLENGIRDGRTSQPRNWPPAEQTSEADRLIAEVLASGDPDEIARLEAALPGELRSHRARHNGTQTGPAPGTPTGADSLEAEISRMDAEEETRTGRPVVQRRPAIAVGTKDNPLDFAEVRKAVQKALGVSNAVDQWLYLHGEDMVLSGRGKFQQVGIDLLVSRLADRIEFMNHGKLNGVPITHPANPPVNVIRAIHADRQNIGLPEVDRVAHTPFFGPDGALQREPGYHPKARTLYVPTPDLDIPDVPERPTPEQVAAVRSLILDDLLVDFPFVGDADRAGALALGITPFIRPMIDGPTPLFALDSPESRTGKGLLMEMLLVPSSGRGYSVTPAPRRPDEWQKQIVAALRPGPVAAIFDNVSSRIDSAALASAVTAYPMWTSRLLGLSENVHMPLPAVWCCTGNNLVASREVANRTVWSRMDAGVADPGLRNDFKHPNLRRWATEHRGDIIATFLTLVQNWIAAGQPEPEGLPVMGGFEGWVRILGSILAHHGVKGLLGNRQLLVDHLDDTASQWEGLIGLMANGGRAPTAEGDDGDVGDPEMTPPPIPATPRTAWTATPRTAWTAAELVTLLNAADVDTPVDLGFGTVTVSSSTQARRLGTALRAQRDRRFGGHVLRMRTIRGAVSWRVEAVKVADPPA